MDKYQKHLSELYGDDRRRNGSLAVSHFTDVAKRVSWLPTYVQIAAYYHDVIEDRKLTIHQLFELDIPMRSKKMVLDMTRMRGEWYISYILRIIRKKDHALSQIKIADIQSNSDEFARPIKRFFLYPLALFFL